MSVEVQDNMYSCHDSCDTTICEFVQNWHPDRPNYVYKNTNEIIVLAFPQAQ